MEGYVFYSFLGASISYTLLFLHGFIKKNHSVAFLIAIGFSLLWTISIMLYARNYYFVIADTLVFESLRNCAWFLYLTTLISYQRYGTQYHLLKSKITYVVALFILFTLIIETTTDLPNWIHQKSNMEPRFISHVIFAIFGLMLVEQLYRNSPLEQRWHLKFLCLGIGSLFIVDLITYSKSLLFVKLDFTLWQSRGIINIVIAPLLAIAVKRFSSVKSDLNAPRKAIFYTTILFGSGIYLIFMSLMGIYIRKFDAQWGETAQAVFVFLAILLLVLLFTSGKIRALAKIYFSKHFFHYHYDYRDEWLKLTKSLANMSSLEELKSFTIKALSDLVESSGGGIWMKNDAGMFVFVQEDNFGLDQLEINAIYQFKQTDPLPIYLANKRWVIDFYELAYEPEVYADIDLSLWCHEKKPIWLIVPLLRHNDLEAFVVLTEARVPRKLNWEDHDLLKTVAMQLANALALIKASDELTRTRQFETYHRLSAYLAHDLKNLVTQLALIVKNSEKHKYNHEFIDDVIDTLHNVVNKMQHIVGQLKQGTLAKPPTKEYLNLADILQEIVKQNTNSPKPKIVVMAPDCTASGDPLKLSTILGHLIQNAQEATDKNGWVQIDLEKTEGLAVIKISDNGTGMDRKFIAERLFKPFDTTKGNAGMGIGAYEAREYIQELSGKIQVDSSLGEGSTFTIHLPLIQNTSATTL